MNPGVDIGQLSNVVMSLGLVLAVIFGAAYVLRRTPFGAGGRQKGPLKVVATLPLGPKERLVLVQARDFELLLAVSAAGVFNVGGGNIGAAQAALDGTTAGAQSTEQAKAPVFVLGENS